MNAKHNRWETKWPERISYGLSDAADNLVFQVMTTYLLYFYTDIFGLKAGDVAVLFLIARIADVIESPLVGFMIDRTHSKYGKSRPFFLWFSLPYAIFAILVFITPNFSYGGKLAWAYLTYLGLGFLYTAVNLPITSILPTMSQNQNEITLLGVIRQFNGSAVQIIVAVFTLPLVSLFGHGNQQFGFLMTMIVFGLISFFLIINTFFHVKERFSIKALAHQPIKKVIKIAQKNRPWLILSAVIFLFWLVTAIKNQTTVYYFKYVFKSESLVSIANTFTFSSLIGVLMILRVTQRFGHKQTMMFGMVIALLGQLVLAVGVYLSNLITIFTGILINSVGQGMIVGLVSIMLSDVIRYGTILGAQSEGIFASSNDFGVNLGLGIGGLITAGLFDLSGYQANHVQNQATISMIKLNYVWIPILIYIVMILVLNFYEEKQMYSAIENNAKKK